MDTAQIKITTLIPVSGLLSSTYDKQFMARISTKSILGKFLNGNLNGRRKVRGADSIYS